MDSQKFELELAGRKLTIEINKAAEQASGSAFVRYGDTLVLATAVASVNQSGSQGFFPLTVEYEERYYAAGKIKGPRYIKREGRPSDKAILNARLIDRTIRPRFPKNFSHEVQVVITVLSWDTQNDPDTLAIIAASTALITSNIPWQGPLAAVRVGQIENEYVLNPTSDVEEKIKFQMVISGDFKDNELIINMLEGEGAEADEDSVVKAADFAKPYLKQIIDLQKQIASKLSNPKLEPEAEDENAKKTARQFLEGKIDSLIVQQDRTLKQQAENDLKKSLADFMKEKYPEANVNLSLLFDEETDRVLTENILEKGIRPDKRKLDQVREISCQVGLLPRTHGSGFFCRGQTKALSILTLGAPGDQQILEGMEITGKKRYMHHYNFPPYSVGEVKPMRGPGRREIGHGMLAERALLPLIPGFEEFPYTIRVVSEILSSNGSTSMASVSGSSLALMDAGVPIKRQAAGIAIGMLADEDSGKYVLLTDIQGPEDHHGDMDFKVAGTRLGITVLQMDVKTTGITQKIMAEALAKARKARNEILDVTEKTISEPRKELSLFAPRILKLQINPDKIREVVGPGGKIINEIIAQTGAMIDIQQTGLIFITAETEEAAKKALAWIENITHEVKVGETFKGKVTRIFDFGAMVEFLPNQEGLIHISELAPYRVGKVEDIVKIGDVVPVKVISIDQQGRTNLSLKEMLKHEGETRFPQKGRN